MIKRVLGGLRRRLLPQGPKPPVVARHVLPSWLCSLDDEPVQPSDWLLDVALAAADAARRVDLTAVSGRIVPPGIRYPDVWPGEHYRFLAALVQTLAPQIVVEIGTAEGLSALTLRRFLPSGGRVVTFDIIPWNEFPGSVLKADDFADGCLSQQLDDLSDPDSYKRHEPVLAAADLLFVDAPKDGNFEPAFLRLLESTRRAQRLLVVLDDVRLINMVGVWRAIQRPKLDVTSFGHWSGTGLVEWC
jgi:predicted O-methyltransferase YrrM